MRQSSDVLPSAAGGAYRPPGRSLTEKKSVPVHSFPKKARGHTMCWQWAVGGRRLATGGRWRLVVVGGGWWLVIGG